MRIVCTSDTHERHDKVALPSGDVLIHAGDISMGGTEKAIRGGFNWLSCQPHKRILFVPGNHDFAFERSPDLASKLAIEFPRVEVLIDREAMVSGHRVYGSPFQPLYRDLAFNFPPSARGERIAEEKWDLIPDDVEILIVHGPVRYVLDQTASGEYVGCIALRDRVRALKNLRLFVCGHIHEGYGTQQIGDVLFINAAACDFEYQPSGKPIVVDFDDQHTTLIHD